MQGCCRPSVGTRRVARLSRRAVSARCMRRTWLRRTRRRRRGERWAALVEYTFGHPERIQQLSRAHSTVIPSAFNSHPERSEGSARQQVKVQIPRCARDDKASLGMTRLRSLGPRSAVLSRSCDFSMILVAMRAAMFASVSQHAKRLSEILSGSQDQTIRFDDLCRTLVRLGFVEARSRGSHRIFYHESVPDIVNLQPRRDGTAKPYQVRQVRELILRCRLTERADAEATDE